MSQTITQRSHFSNSLSETALPWAKNSDAIIFNKYDQRTRQFPALYKMMTTDKPFVQTNTFGGFPTFRMVTEGGRVNYMGIKQGFKRTYTFTKYGAAYFITPEMMDDDQIDIVGKMATDFGNAAAETEELLGAELYNKAFDPATLGPDGVPLISTSHPLITGGVQSNAASSVSVVGLSYAGLSSVRTQMRKMVDHSGRKIKVGNQYQLVVPPDLETTAITITKSIYDPTNANNQVNVHKHMEGGMPTVMVYDYLTSATAWFLKAPPSEMEIRCYRRQPLRMMHEKDFESLGGIKHGGGFRIGFGWSDFYGIIGSPGV